SNDANPLISSFFLSETKEETRSGLPHSFSFYLWRQRSKYTDIFSFFFYKKAYSFFLDPDLRDWQNYDGGDKANPTATGGGQSSRWLLSWTQASFRLPFSIADHRHQSRSSPNRPEI
ncbi:unnamed protein product, partial [Linum tenue]